MIDVKDKRNLPIFIHSELDDYGLTPVEFRVYARIARRAGHGTAEESVPNMATACQVSVRTVQRSLQSLVDKGLLSKTERNFATTQYVLRPVHEWSPGPNPHDGICWYCGVVLTAGDESWTTDHQIPLSRGGTNDRQNLVDACGSCNSRKNSKTVEEYRQYLIGKGESGSFHGDSLTPETDKGTPVTSSSSVTKEQLPQNRHSAAPDPDDVPFDITPRPPSLKSWEAQFAELVEFKGSTQERGWTVIGQEKRVYGDERVIEACRLTIEKNADNPIGYLRTTLKNRATPPTDPYAETAAYIEKKHGSYRAAFIKFVRGQGQDASAAEKAYDAIASGEAGPHHAQAAALHAIVSAKSIPNLDIVHSFTKTSKNGNAWAAAGRYV